MITMGLNKIKKILKSALTLYYYTLFILFYPSKKELAHRSPLQIRGYIIPQKILNINKARNIPWPVHFTSLVSGNLSNISVGFYTAPGFMPGCYIQAINGINFGNNVYIAPGVKILSANHDFTDYRKHTSGKPIKIGNNVWIGSNAIILPEVTIGNDVIIGAGSVVTHDIESNCIAVGNPAKVIGKKEDHCTIFNDSYHD